MFGLFAPELFQNVAPLNQWVVKRSLTILEFFKYHL